MTSSRLRHLLLEPYRLFFGTGALYSTVIMAIWFLWLRTPSALPLGWQFSPSAVHAHVMIYGVVGFYVFGFLMTAFPRWVNQPFPSKFQLMGIYAAMVLGQVALLRGSLADRAWMTTAAVFELIAYVGLFTLLGHRYRRSHSRDTQPRYVLVALFCAIAGIILFYAPLLFPRFSQPLTASIEIGAYAYLLLLVIAITYRIVPFFAGRVIEGYEPKRGSYTLALATNLVVIRLMASNVLQYYPISWAADLILLLVLLNEWRGWFTFKISKIPMLAVLFMGFSWIVLFLLFSAYEWIHFLTASHAITIPQFRTLALHALLVGAFGTLLIAISTRVVRGHGGLPIQADAFVIIPMILMQVAAILRVFGPIAATAGVFSSATFQWAGALWSIAFGIWSIRYIPILLRAPANPTPPLPGR